MRLKPALLTPILSLVIPVSLCGATRASEQLQPDDPLAPLTRGSLDVWAPDTFFTGASANFVHEYEWSSLLSEFKSDFPQFDLRFKVMARAVFVDAIHSTNPKPPPDIVFADNQSERGPLMASDDAIEMLGLSRFHQNGFWLILRHSKNFEAAEAFLLWLARSPHWQPPQTATAPMQPADTAAAESVSTDAVKEYWQADARALSSVLDPQASRFYRLTPSESVQRVQSLLTFGNSRLAFVLTSAVCRQQKSFGMSHSALVLRKIDDQWKILLFLEGSLPRLLGVLTSFDRLRLHDGTQEALPVVPLQEPPDHAGITRFPPGELAWTPLNSPLASYLVESQFSGPNPLARDWSLSSVKFVGPARGEQLIRVQIPFGVGQQPHRWRVWAISDTGDLSISEWRSIDFTN